MINKLRALLDAANQDIDQLVLLRNNVLPELLAVVEAADLLTDDSHVDLSIKNWDAVIYALAALNAKLGADK